MAYRSKHPNVYNLRSIRKAHDKLTRQVNKLGKTTIASVGKAAQDEVLSAARKTPLGRLHGELSSMSGDQLQRLILSSTGLSEIVGAIHYGKGGNLLGKLLGVMGPLGALFGELIGALSKDRGVSVHDLKAAAQLLTAAGFQIGSSGGTGLSPVPVKPKVAGGGQTVPTAPPSAKPSPGKPATPPIPPHGPPTAPAAPQPALPIGSAPGQQFINMTMVTNSSNVYAYGYNPDTLTLRVQFLGTAVSGHALSHPGGENLRNPHGHKGKNRVRGKLGQTLTSMRRGAGPVYDYRGVPERVFRRFESAGSKGKAVWDLLRIRGTIFGHQYDYSLVAAAVVDVVKPNLRSPSMEMQTVGSLTYVPRKATVSGFKPRSIKQGSATYRSVLPGTGMHSLGKRTP